jgi:hypothetical protein
MEQVGLTERLHTLEKSFTVQVHLLVSLNEKARPTSPSSIEMRVDPEITYLDAALASIWVHSA